jgi:hypothetical protein
VNRLRPSPLSQPKPFGPHSLPLYSAKQELNDQDPIVGPSDSFHVEGNSTVSESRFECSPSQAGFGYFEFFFGLIQIDNVVGMKYRQKDLKLSLL